ncbi:MAG: hypothetical protein VB957_01200 [Pseudomonadales bacterium]
MTFVVVLLAWTIGSLIVGAIARQRGSRGLRSFLVSLLVSPVIGLILVFVAESKKEENADEPETDSLNADPLESDAGLNSKADPSASSEIRAEMNASTNILSPEEAVDMRRRAAGELDSGEIHPQNDSAIGNAKATVISPEELDALRRAAADKKSEE